MARVVPGLGSLGAVFGCIGAALPLGDFHAKDRRARALPLLFLISILAEHAAWFDFVRQTV